MENQLAILISTYEDERNRLQKMLTDYLNDFDTDYLSAHYCSIALSQNNYQLQILKHLEDPLYSEKLRHSGNISFYEKMMTDEFLGVSKEYYEQQILKAKKEIECLNQIPKYEVNEDSSSIIDEFLSKLLNNQLAKAELILNNSNNLSLQFRYIKRTVTLKIPFLKKHIAKQVLYEDRVISLKKIGFQITNDENNLVMLFAGEKEEILIRIKSVLAKIVFDVFHFSEFQNETFLKFVEKTNKN